MRYLLYFLLAFTTGCDQGEEEQGRCRVGGYRTPLSDVGGTSYNYVANMNLVVSGSDCERVWGGYFGTMCKPKTTVQFLSASSQALGVFVNGCELERVESVAGYEHWTSEFTELLFAPPAGHHVMVEVEFAGELVVRRSYKVPVALPKLIEPASGQRFEENESQLARWKPTQVDESDWVLLWFAPGDSYIVPDDSTGMHRIVPSSSATGVALEVDVLQFDERTEGHSLRLMIRHVIGLNGPQ